MPRQYTLTERAFHGGTMRERGEVVTLRDDERPGSHMRPYTPPEPVKPIVVEPISGRIVKGPELPVIADVLDSPQSVPESFSEVQRISAISAPVANLVENAPAVIRPRHRGYLILDTETSGFKDPRVAAIAMAFADEDLLTEYEYTALIKPDGWSMEPSATQVNGLTNERLEAEGLDLMEALAVFEVAVLLRRTIVVHNADFDLRVVRGELRRRKRLVGVMPFNAICTMLAARRIIGVGKLSAAYENVMGEPLIGAHDAKADMRACQALFGKLIERGLNPGKETFQDFGK